MDSCIIPPESYASIPCSDFFSGIPNNITDFIFNLAISSISEIKLSKEI